MNNLESFRSILCRELASRGRRNPRYSLRAFARSLRVDPAVLSRLLSGKRLPSSVVAKRILASLALSPDESRRFTDSLRAAQLKRRPSANLDSLAVPPFEHLDDEVFSIISDWQHYAILELSYVKGFRADPAWIARELAISWAEAKDSLERLLTNGLLRKTRGRVRKSSAWITTADKTATSSALRRRQKQILEKSIRSLEEHPIEARNHTCMTMAIDEKHFTQAKEMILEFQRKLCSFLEGGDQTRVYELSVSLFPLQRLNGKKTKENAP